MVAQLWDEVEILKERQNARYVTLAVLIQQATSTTGFVASKDTIKGFNEFIKMLGDD